MTVTAADIKQRAFLIRLPDGMPGRAKRILAALRNSAQPVERQHLATMARINDDHQYQRSVSVEWWVTSSVTPYIERFGYTIEMLPTRSTCFYEIVRK